MTPTPSHLISGLLDPVAVTVVGASPNGYLTEHLLRNLANHSMRFRGKVNFVNPGYKRLFGHQCLSDVQAVEGEIGVLFFLVNLDACLPILERLTKMPQSVVVFAEEHAGTSDEQAADEISRWGLEHGVPILGPQSNGLIVSAAGLLGLLVPVVEDVRPGHTVLLSQSGGILGGMVKCLSQRGVGIHSAFEFGTAAMLTMENLALGLLERDDVRLVALYADGIRSVRDFAALLARAQVLSKTVVFMIGGASEAGSRAAASHSGMAATPRKLLSGLADQFGAIQAATLDEVVWSVEAIASANYRTIDGGHVVLFSDSGGADITMADALAGVGVELVEPSPQTKKSLGLEEHESANPVDFGSQSMGQADNVNRTIAQITADEQFGIGAFASILGLPRNEQSTHLGQIADFATEVAKLGKLPFVASLFPFAPTTTVVEHAIVGTGSIESAVKLRALRSRGRQDPAPASRKEREGGIPAFAADPLPLTGDAAIAELKSLPLAWPRSATITSLSDLDDASGLPSFPLVVKSEAGLAHRAKMGGVLQGITDTEILRSAADFLLRRFNGPVSLTETVKYEDEFFVGAFRTADLVTLLFGPGGGRAEETASVRVSPVTDAQLERVVRPHAGSHWRIFADLLRSLECWMAEHPEVESVDLNPVVVVEQRGVALDAKIQQGARTR